MQSSPNVWQVWLVSLTRYVGELENDVSGHELSTLTCMQEWRQTDRRERGEMEREKGRVRGGRGGGWRE